jgi:hypothetical protein
VVHMHRGDVAPRGGRQGEQRQRIGAARHRACHGRTRGRERATPEQVGVLAVR